MYEYSKEKSLVDHLRELTLMNFFILFNKVERKSLKVKTYGGGNQVHTFHQHYKQKIILKSQQTCNR